MNKTDPPLSSPGLSLGLVMGVKVGDSNLILKVGNILGIIKDRNVITIANQKMNQDACNGRGTA